MRLPSFSEKSGFSAKGIFNLRELSPFICAYEIPSLFFFVILYDSLADPRLPSGGGGGGGDGSFSRSAADGVARDYEVYLLCGRARAFPAPRAIEYRIRVRARTGKLAAPAPAKFQRSVASENTGHHSPRYHTP